VNPARTSFFDEIAPQWDEKSGPEAIERVRTWCANLPLPSDGVVVDLGCGTGISSQAIVEGTNRRVVAVDLSLEMLRNGQSKRHADSICWVCSNAMELPLADAVADGVLALHVLPHLERRGIAFSEWRRVLKPGGSLFITHLMSRARVNEIHRSGPEAIHDDILPPARELAGELVSHGFCVLETEDSHERYLLHCARL